MSQPVEAHQLENYSSPNGEGIHADRSCITFDTDHAEVIVVPVAKHFADPWNPEPGEIRAWAYDADAMCPEQDFDLSLSWVGHEKAYLELTQDEACPKRRFFLGVLYLMVGDAVRSGFRVVPEPVVRGLVDHGNDFDHPEIRLWQERSRSLLANHDLFDYDLWGGGGYAHGTEA